MATNDSAFVFYESFLKSIQNVERFRGKEEAFDFAMSIMEYGCYGLPPDDTNSAWLYGFEQVRASIDAAQDRRQRQIAQGKTGGRPRKSANIDEILQMRASGLSVRAIAERLNISDKTVRRRLQEHESNCETDNSNQDKTSQGSFVPQWDITGQRTFVPIDVDKDSTDLSEASKYNCSSHDGWDKTGQKDKTGQNLNVNVNVNKNENDFLGGRAACPIDGSKTTVDVDKTGTKPPDKFCPTMGQNLYNDFCPVEGDKTQRQNWDKNGQNLPEEFCPSVGQNPCHDICPDELDKTLLTKMGQKGTKPSHEFCPNEGQNPTIVNRDKNGQNPTTMFCPTIISRVEAEELVATSRENLYISGNKVLCEDDDREWLIL